MAWFSELWASVVHKLGVVVKSVGVVQVPSSLSTKAATRIHPRQLGRVRNTFLSYEIAVDV